MKRISIQAALVALGVTLAGATPIIGAQTSHAEMTAHSVVAEKPAFLVLDILPLKKGKTVEEAAVYMQDVEPYLARHGMTRLDTVLQVEQVVRGDFDGRVVNLWLTDNPEASFKSVFSDAEYIAKFTARRESLFDMKNATIVVTKRDEG